MYYLVECFQGLYLTYCLDLRRNRVEICLYIQNILIVLVLCSQRSKLDTGRRYWILRNLLRYYYILQIEDVETELKTFDLGRRMYMYMSYLER